MRPKVQVGRTHGYKQVGPKFLSNIGDVFQLIRVHYMVNNRRGAS
jgi:hypothetical protein